MPDRYGRTRGESTVPLANTQEGTEMSPMRTNVPINEEEEIDVFRENDLNDIQSEPPIEVEQPRKPVFSDRGLLRLSLACSILALGLVLAMILQYLFEGIAVSRLQPIDCSGVTYRQATTWNGTGGVYVVCPQGYPMGIEVYCDVTSNGGGWLVFQRRMDGSINFNRNWKQYVAGFGNPKGEFWLGLEPIHRLTQNGSFELRVDMVDWKGNTVFARYGRFKVAGANKKYALTVNTFVGNADAGDSLSWHNEMEFTTFDADNDRSDTNCASSWKGGWWYNNCLDVNLNGVWVVDGLTTPQKGILWKHFSGLTHSLKFVEMKFRKIISN